MDTTTTLQEEVLIARNSETGQIGAVTGLNEDGTPKMADMKSAKLSDLVKFQKGQNPLEAFLSNFLRQCKNPSVFGFFKVKAENFDTEGKALGSLLENPEANAEMLKGNKVEMPSPQQQNHKRVDETKVDWDSFKNQWGLDKNQLSAKDISEMLNNRKSKLVTLTPTMFGETFELQARLSLKENPDGSISLRPHCVKNMPDLKQEFNGVKFSDRDIEMLEKTGNLGRVVELTDASGNKIPSFVSLDRETHELLIHPASEYIKPTIGKNELSNKEIGILKAGKQLVKEGYVDNSGTTKTVVLQFNAANPGVEFVPEKYQIGKIEKREQRQQEWQEQKQQGRNWLNPDGSIHPIGKWKDYNFSEQEKADYVAGKTVKAEITDNKGEKATVYVKFNPDKGRPIPYRKDPDLITPTNESKTQMSVNNDGQTNEATKNLKDPLQKGQVQPKDDDQQKQQRKPKGPKL